MPSSDKHLLIGCIAGILAYAGYKINRGEKIRLDGAIKSVIIGGLSALAPDIIEPATNPNHRSRFHSITALSGGGYGTHKWLQNCDSEELRELLAAAFAGYTSHLLLDGTTPKSIPII